MSVKSTDRQLNLPPVEVQTVHPSHPNSPSGLTQVNGDDAAWLDLPRAAFARGRMKHETAAAAMGISPSLLSAQLTVAPLNEQKHLSFLRMKNLPRAFWGELIPMLAEWHDLSFGSNERAREDAVLGARTRELFHLLRGER